MKFIKKNIIIVLAVLGLIISFISIDQTIFFGDKRSPFLQKLSNSIPHEYRDFIKRKILSQGYIKRLEEKIYTKENQYKNSIKIISSNEISFEKNIDTLIRVNDSVKFKFKFYKLDANFPGKNLPSNSKNTAYIDFFKENLIWVSASGIFSKSKFHNNNLTDKKLKIFKSNISDFINYDEFYDYSWFGIKDIFIDKEKIYVSFTNQLKNNCFNTSVLVADMNLDFLKFEYFFEFDDCIETVNDYGEFNAHQSGGRITDFKNNELLFSIGEYRYRTKAQEKNSLFGKIIAINKNNPNKFRIVSKGHRNVQGLKYIKEKNWIISSEHGPNGGDEINIQQNTNSIANFGWPISSYGEHYARFAPIGDHNEGNKKELEEIIKTAPLYKSHSEYGFIEPFQYFDPSIGISEIEYFNLGENYYLFASSLGEKSSEGDFSIHIYNLENKSKIGIINFERRIRDVLKEKNSNTLFLSFETEGGIGVLNYVN